MNAELTDSAASTDDAQLNVKLTSASSPGTNLSLIKGTTPNVLTLTIGNPTDGPVQFVAGNDATSSVIRIAFGGLLKPAELAAVKIIAAGWQAKPPVTIRHVQVLELRPAQTVPMPSGGSQVFTITVPTIGSDPTSDTISIEYRNVGGIADNFVNMQIRGAAADHQGGRKAAPGQHRLGDGRAVRGLRVQAHY